MLPRNRLPGLVAAFLDTQRVPPGSRLSAWLHGESIVARNDGEQGSTYNVNQYREKIDHEALHTKYPQPNMDAQQSHPSTGGGYGPRVNFSRPLMNEGHRDPASPVRAAPTTTFQSGSHRSYQQSSMQGRPKISLFQHHRFMLSHSKDPRVQCKSIGTLVSGTVLIVVLTVYLALATANIVPTLAFHATFIFCIIVATIVFSHFLIRLCMLTVRAKPKASKYRPSPIRHHRRRRRPHHHSSDIEASMETSSDTLEQVIRHSNSRSIAVEDNVSDFVAPPPAYGWWRGSIRVNPEDLRHCPSDVELHQRTRGLVFAGSGQRPPSYTSDPIEDVECPAPLFNARRISMREHSVREV